MRAAGGWVPANHEVKNAQDERLQKLVEAKRQGIVTNIPRIFEYGPLAVHPQGAFSPAKRPTLWLNIKGAICVRLPPCASRPAP